MMTRIEEGLRRKIYKGGIRPENNENKAGNYTKAEMRSENED